jgi:peptidoglycan/xylan/chitin deacetylase (PgdA/CDA1 family)
MELSSDVAFRGILPLVLHKVVLDKSVDWVDVQESDFCELLDFIGDRWIVPHLNWSTEEPRWMLTFDDGNISDYEVVFPLLIEKKIKATFFLIVNKIGSEGYLNWSQVIEMHRNGMCIGSHSFSHPRMTTLSKKDAIRELNDSKKKIEDFLSAPVSSFSYPFGEYSLELNKLCMELGYQFIFTSHHGILNSFSNIFPRNSINSSMSWPSIVEEINPSSRKLLKWKMEDYLKKLIKSFFGQDNYLEIRNKIYNINKK